MTASRTPVPAARAAADVAAPWRVVAEALRVGYRTRDMVIGGAFVTRIIEAAERADHHPDIDLRHGSVHLSLMTHSSHRITEADVALANTIARIADEMGLSGLSTPPQECQITIDALDIGAIRPFWRAVLGYREDPEHAETDLSDPAGRGPGIWFQQMDSPRPQRNRVHIDLQIPADEVPARVQAAQAAGGRLLTEHHAPAFWVLADPEGNEICLCTWQEPATH
ncbi:MAG: VOC family protein [Gordonia sp. (in: high G+C Gram-positive bacteria)]